MDLNKDVINEYVNGDINEQINVIAKKRLNTIMRHKYPNGWNDEQYNEELSKMRASVRQEILENMRFKHEYERLKHIERIENQQRHLDAKKTAIDESLLNDEWWLKRRQYESEEKILKDDIDGINPNGIVDSYKLIADYFNITDTHALKSIIKQAQDGTIDKIAFRSLIPGKYGNQAVEALIQSNNGQLSVSQLINQVFSAMQSLANSRVATSKGYMEVAKEDLDARAYGIERKIDALNKIKDSSLVKEDIYGKAISSLEKRKAMLKPADIENATSGIRISSIKSENAVIKPAEQTNDNKEMGVIYE